MASAPYLELVGITKSFGDNVVLDNVNLNISYNEITGIIGQSGSGKTTLLNLLIGFLKPNKGKIIFQSRDIFTEIKHVNTLFGFGSQSCSFYDYLTVEENLRYFADLYSIKKKEATERIEYVLNLLELSEEKKQLGQKLSTGMQRRLDIACALIHKPKVLILDEPTEDLDPVLRKEIIKIIKKIKSEGTTIIFTSHLLNEVENFCDKIAILSNSKIVAFDTPSNLKSKYKRKNLDDVFTEIVQEAKKKKISRIPQKKGIFHIISNLKIKHELTKPRIKIRIEKVDHKK